MIITTRMPAARHRATAARHAGAQRIGEADQPQELERQSRAASPGKRRRASVARATPSTRRPSAAMASTALVSRASSLRARRHSPRDRLGRAFRGDDEPAAVVGLARLGSPRAGRGAGHSTRSRLRARARAASQCSRAELMERLLHRVERILRARENAVAHELAKRLGKRFAAHRATRNDAPSGEPQLARSTSGSRSACRSCRCRARSRSRASRSPRRGA